MIGRRTAMVAVVVVLLVGVPAFAQAPLEKTPATKPALPPGAVALVNGQVVTVKDLADLLMKKHGPQVTRQLVHMRLIEQELQRRGLTVTDQDVEDLFKKHMAEAGGREPYLARIRQSGATLDYVKNVELRTTCALIKLAGKEADVSDEEVQRAFTANFGEKRQIRRILLDKILIAADVVKQLEGGADFAALARKYSIDSRGKQNGGLTSPFGRGGLPQALKEVENAAFDLKVGQTSGIVAVGKQFYVIKLEGIIPARTDVKLDDVKDKLRAAIHNRKVIVLSNRIIGDLKKKAAIVMHPDLQTRTEK